MTRPSISLIAALAVLGAPAADGTQDALRVRAALESAPCVEAAGEAWRSATGRKVVVETGGLRDAGAWDVLVGSSVELTRALEGGEAATDSDVDIAYIPWVIQLGAGSPRLTLDDLARPGVEAVMLGGVAAYEARRALAERGVGRVLETRDVQRLRAAAVALVPLSLVAAGERLPVDVPPIRVGAAVGARARHGADARAFVRYLGSEPGQRAFAACVPAQ